MLDSQRDYPRSLSFEFFPPHTKQGQQKLQSTAKKLASYNPEFFSVTFGAGGSETQSKTLETVLDLLGHTKIALAPHLSCITTTKKQVQEFLHTYENHNIKHIVAIRGDVLPNLTASGDFQHAHELVKYIREHSGDQFNIHVAAYPEFHPESITPFDDIQRFKEKVEAGANYAITQYFYNIDAYLQFVHQCAKEHIKIPIIPGIMPILNCEQIERFSDNCGADIPRWIRKQLEAYQKDPESLMKFGVDIVTELCDKLLEAGAPGLHFYTLNKLETTVQICENLNLKERMGL